MKDTRGQMESCAIQRSELSTRDPQLLLHKLRELHTEAEKEYGLKLFTAFLGNGGKTIETIVNSQDAAIVKVMMNDSAKQRQQAMLKSLNDENRIPECAAKQEQGSEQRNHQHQQHQWPEHCPWPSQQASPPHSCAQLHGHGETQIPQEKHEQGQVQQGCDELYGQHCWPSTDVWQLKSSTVSDDALTPPRSAPPGLGAAGIWAMEAASLKRKMGSGGVPQEDVIFPSSKVSIAATTVSMPSKNKELAILIRDVVGARPKYGDESARPPYWPADVPWKKGKSISQMNNVTLRRLARAVLQYQAQAHKKSKTTGNVVVPAGVVGCGRRTKKELCFLIRSKLGLRLQYGVKDKRPPFWPSDVPWEKEKPLSMMNHGQLSRILSAMVGAGLCPAGACLDPPHIYELTDSDSGSTVTASPSTDYNNDGDHRNVPDSDLDGSGKYNDVGRDAEVADENRMVDDLSVEEHSDGQIGGISHLDGYNHFYSFDPSANMDRSQDSSRHVGSDGAIDCDDGGSIRAGGCNESGRQVVMQEHSHKSQDKRAYRQAYEGRMGNSSDGSMMFAISCDGKDPRVMGKTSTMSDTCGTTRNMQTGSPGLGMGCVDGTVGVPAGAGMTSFPSIGSLVSLCMPTTSSEVDLREFDDVAVTAVPGPASCGRGDTPTGALFGNHQTLPHAGGDGSARGVREGVRFEHNKTLSDMTYEGAWFYGEAV